MISMLIGNLLLLVLNLPLIRIWVQLLKVPYKILFPLIVMFCMIGTYSVNSSVADMVIMLFFGVMGYLWRKYGYEAAPFILPSSSGPF